MLSSSNHAAFKGIFFGSLSAICYGTNPLGALNLYAAGLSPESVLCYRFFFAAILLALTMCACRRSFAIGMRELSVLLLLGLLFAASSLTYYVSFNFMDAGLASTLLFLYPLEVAIIMGIFFRERLTRKTAISIAVSLVGLLLLYRGGEGSLSIFGLLLVFLSSDLCCLHCGGEQGESQDGVSQAYVLRRCLLPCLYAPFFRNDWRGASSGSCEFKSMGLGIHAWISASIPFACIHGEGG